MLGRKLSTSTHSTCSSSLDQASSSRRSKKKEKKQANMSEMRSSLQAATLLLTANKKTNAAVEHQQPTINCDGLKCKINRGGEHQQPSLNDRSEMRSSLQAAKLLIATKKTNVSKEHKKPGDGSRCKINRGDNANSSMSDLLTGVESSSVTGGSAPELLVEEQVEYLRYAKTHFAPTTSSQHSHTEPLPQKTTTTTPASKQQVPRTKKSVSFSTVSIRHYKRIMTVNPATNKGVSIGIGWSYIQRYIETVDRYHEQRAPLRPCLLLSPTERDELLLGLGYTRPEIATTLRCINGLRNQRRQTVTNLPAEKVEEAVQGVGRRVKRLLGFERRLKPEEEPVLEAKCELCPNSSSSYA